MKGISRPKFIYKRTLQQISAPEAVHLNMWKKLRSNRSSKLSWTRTLTPSQKSRDYSNPTLSKGVSITKLDVVKQELMHRLIKEFQHEISKFWTKLSFLASIWGPMGGRLPSQLSPSSSPVASGARAKQQLVRCSSRVGHLQKVSFR